MDRVKNREKEFLWSQRGITFKIPTPADYKSIKAFLVEIFFPEEPFFRSLKLMEVGNGLIERHFIQFILGQQQMSSYP